MSNATLLGQTKCGGGEIKRVGTKFTGNVFVKSVLIAV